MKRSCLGIALLIVLGAGSVWGGVDGKWAVPVAGKPDGLILEFQSDGHRLKGSIQGPNGKLDLVNGSVDGDRISFEIAVKIGDRTLTIVYHGRVQGDALELEVEAGGGIERLTARRRADGPAPDWFAESPAPAEVTAWLKANAIPLRTVEAGGSFADLEPLLSRLRDVRVVAVGEATHGTREFQQFKVRMFEFLVERLGFTVFAIEANLAQSQAANEYVLYGKGDPDTALAAQVNWWRTPEVRDLLRWMRRYNQDPSHPRKVKFLGFDMQDPGPPEAHVREYLRKVDAGWEEKASQVFAVLGGYGENPAYEQSAPEVKQRTRARLDELLQRFDGQKDEYIRRSSREAWALARHDMALVKQAELKIGDQGDAGRAARDRAMAENAKWLLDQEPAGAKIMLWAHNAHVASDGSQHEPMGGHLRRMYGPEFVNMGFIFGKGSFRAFDMTNNREAAFTLEDPPAGSVDATLAAIGLPLFAADLRNLPPGPVANWFGGERRSRQIGGGYSTATPGVWIQPMRPARAFDFLIFIARTTPSGPL
jgi:erythromycin esterase